MGHMVSDKKIFSCFSLYKSEYVKHVTPGAVPFWPQGYNLIKLGKVHLVMLHTKYQGSRTYGFRQEDLFNVFPYISLCKRCDPRGGPFLAPGI